MTPLVPVAMFGLDSGRAYAVPQAAAAPGRDRGFHRGLAFSAVARYEFSGLPEYTKMSATCVGILLSAFLFASEYFQNYRFHWLDFPMFFWCVSPCISSLSNELGLYDGISALVNQSTIWALPYIIGRLFLNKPEAVRELTLGLFVGGLVYIPFCVFELRMSPQLHRILYGFHAHPDFAQSIRFGGYRPMVFMEHGLMVGMWMASASLLGIWLWYGKVVDRLRGYKMWKLAACQLVITVMVKSSGHWVDDFRTVRPVRLRAFSHTFFRRHSDYNSFFLYFRQVQRGLDGRIIDREYGENQ